MAQKKINMSLVDSDDGSTYILEVTPEEAARLKTDVAFAFQKLEEFKCAKMMAELLPIESATVLPPRKSLPLVDSGNLPPIHNESLPSDSSIQQKENVETEDASIFKWPHEAILLLIEEYRKRADDFYSGRVSQKKTWVIIANELIKMKYNVTWPQCQSKFAGLKRTYKSIKDHNAKSGNGTRSWAYFSVLDSLLGSKPYITPIATSSSSGKRDLPIPSSDSVMISTEPTLKKKKLHQTSSVDKIIAVIEEGRKMVEENKEKRHQEKLKQKEEALKLLSKLVGFLEKQPNDK